MTETDQGFQSLDEIACELLAAGRLPGFGDPRRVAVLRWEIRILRAPLRRRLQELRRLTRTAGAEREVRP